MGGVGVGGKELLSYIYNCQGRSCSSSEWRREKYGSSSPFLQKYQEDKKGARDQVNEAHMYIAIIKRSQLLIRCKENHIFGPTSTVIDIYRQP